MAALPLSQVSDDQAAEAFAERVAAILDAGAVSVMLSLGHRTALFDVMARLPAAGSREIAGAAGLAERYVREWLAVMVMAGIVHYEPEGRTYALPAAHAASLTRGARLGNLALYGQHVALMGAAEDRVLECFTTGGGLGYHDFPGFHRIMEEDSAQTVTARLFDAILPLVPGLIERLREGLDVLDAGCGRGSALIALATRFPASRFTGYDACADAVGSARAAARSAGLANLTFEQRDLATYEDRACLDLVFSFDAVHDQRDPEDLLLRLRRALRPGGAYVMQDIGGSARLENNSGFPMAAFLYAISCTHCTPVSIGQGGAGLGTMWGWETAEGMLRAVGFRAVERHALPHDPMNVWFVCRA